MLVFNYKKVFFSSSLRQDIETHLITFNKRVLTRIITNEWRLIFTRIFHHFLF